MVIWYILWPLGIFCGHLVHFSRFGKLYHEKPGKPGLRTGVENMTAFHTHVDKKSSKFTETQDETISSKFETKLTHNNSSIFIEKHEFIEIYRKLLKLVEIHRNSSKVFEIR
jgi:hypothetical protein